MDIPAPQKNNESVASDHKDSALNKRNEVEVSEGSVQESNDESHKKIAELVSSKKYNLAIKEKRTKPLLDFSLGIRHKKKQVSKKHTKKSQEPKKPQSKKKKIIESVAIIGLWVGLFIAIDLGLIDIGWKPPFSLFNKGENQQILNFTSEAGQ